MILSPDIVKHQNFEVGFVLGHDAYEADEFGFYKVNITSGEKKKKYFDIRELVRICTFQNICKCNSSAISNYGICSVVT